MPSAWPRKSTRPQAFLDPLIVVRGEDGRLWTPNGRHRLAAGKVLGLRQITVLISPDETLAYRILALNTEKAHNLRDRSLEVVRMARSLAKRQGMPRKPSSRREFEAPELLTLGIVYEKASRFAGGAYSAFLKKVDRFSERTLHASLREREGYAARLIEIDTEVKKIIAALTKRGFKSPYLRNYVAARINPVRFHKAEERRHQASHAHRAGADADGGGRQEIQRGVGLQQGSGVGCGRRGRVTSPRLTLLRSNPPAPTVRSGPHAAPSGSTVRARTSANSRPAG